jgi:hypothetical protein
VTVPGRGRDFSMRTAAGRGAAAVLVPPLPVCLHVAGRRGRRCHCGFAVSVRHAQGSQGSHARNNHRGVRRDESAAAAAVPARRCWRRGARRSSRRWGWRRRCADPARSGAGPRGACVRGRFLGCSAPFVCRGRAAWIIMMAVCVFLWLPRGGPQARSSSSNTRGDCSSGARGWAAAAQSLRNSTPLLVFYLPSMHCGN